MTNTFIVKAAGDDRFFMIDLERLTVDQIDGRAHDLSSAETVSMEVLVAGRQRAEASSHPIFKPN